MMNKNPDGTITLSTYDVRRLDTLIAEAERRQRDPGFFTSDDATQFAREWKDGR
jgi:hypothetical protein